MLGQSLKRLAHDDRLTAQIAFSNRLGLPEVYKARLSAAQNNDVLVFVHDDVWIDDYFLADRVIEGPRHYDLIGVAGNRRRVKHQPAWAFVDRQFTWDERANLSGAATRRSTVFE